MFSKYKSIYSFIKNLFQHKIVNYLYRNNDDSLLINIMVKNMFQLYGHTCARRLGYAEADEYIIYTTSNRAKLMHQATILVRMDSTKIHIIIIIRSLIVPQNWFINKIIINNKIWREWESLLTTEDQFTYLRDQLHIARVITDKISHKHNLQVF